MLIFKKRSPADWNLDLTKCQGTGKIGSLNRGFVISRFVSHTFYCDLISLG